jgi:hypothetical protein
LLVVSFYVLKEEKKKKKKKKKKQVQKRGPDLKDPTSRADLTNPRPRGK